MKLSSSGHRGTRRGDDTLWCAPSAPVSRLCSLLSLPSATRRSGLSPLKLWRFNAHSDPSSILRSAASNAAPSDRVIFASVDAHAPLPISRLGHFLSFSPSRCATRCQIGCRVSGLPWCRRGRWSLCARALAAGDHTGARACAAVFGCIVCESFCSVADSSL